MKEKLIKIISDSKTDCIVCKASSDKKCSECHEEDAEKILAVIKEKG